jgi:hypothetical protein
VTGGKCDCAEAKAFVRVHITNRGDLSRRARDDRGFIRLGSVPPWLAKLILFHGNAQETTDCANPTWLDSQEAADWATDTIYKLWDDDQDSILKELGINYFEDEDEDEELPYDVSAWLQRNDSRVQILEAVLVGMDDFFTDANLSNVLFCVTSAVFKVVGAKVLENTSIQIVTTGWDSLS